MPAPLDISPGCNDPASPHYKAPEPEPDPDYEYERMREKEIEEQRRIENEAEHVCGEPDV